MSGKWFDVVSYEVRESDQLIDMGLVGMKHGYKGPSIEQGIFHVIQVAMPSVSIDSGEAIKDRGNIGLPSRLKGHEPATLGESG